MSQTALITLLAILLYTGGLFGGPRSGKIETAPPGAHSISEQKGVVRASTVAVHDAPRSRNIIANLVRGDEVTILGEAGGWYEVRLPNGQTGFVNTFAVTTATTSIPAARPGRYDVFAYYVTDLRRPSMPSLRENVDVITAVVPWMWQVTPDGDLLADFSSGEVAQALAFAGSRGAGSYALVHNLRQTASGAITFDAALASELLANPASRARAAEAILRRLEEWSMSGVHIDFEQVLPRDRQNLNLFLKTLAERLRPAGFSVTIAVPAKVSDSAASSWSGGYDYATIARYVDKMVLMTYDEHWRGGEPGPVASIGWVEKVVRYALSVGVPPEKIILGIPAYGYDWPRRGQGRAVTYAEAMELAGRHGVRIEWDDEAKVPHFTYGDGRKVYFENRASIAHKIGLVKKYGLAGVSLWRLGQEDPGIWTVIRSELASGQSAG